MSWNSVNSALGQIIVKYYILVGVRSSGSLIAKQKLGVAFNFDKQDVIDFTKFSKMTMHVLGLRSTFRKVVIDPLFWREKIIKGLVFLSVKAIENINSQTKFEKTSFFGDTYILISKNGPDMASVHKSWYFFTCFTAHGQF